MARRVEAEGAAELHNFLREITVFFMAFVRMPGYAVTEKDNCATLLGVGVFFISLVFERLFYLRAIQTPVLQAILSESGPGLFVWNGKPEWWT